MKYVVKTPEGKRLSTNTTIGTAMIVKEIHEKRGIECEIRPSRKRIKTKPVTKYYPGKVVKIRRRTKI